MKNIAIVGGGITGLAAAYELQQAARSGNQAVRFSLYESESRLGGKILTQEVEGFTIEGGPDSFIRQKPWAARLAQQVGLGAELIGTNPLQRSTFVLNHGPLTPLPEGVMLIVPTRILPFVTSSLISWPGKIRMGMDLFIPPRPADGDESVGDFIRRRLGQEALEKIAGPLMSGIHVSDPEQQSLLGTFPRFRDLELKHGSLIRGMLAQRRNIPSTHSVDSSIPNSAFVSLSGGMEQLVSALRRQLAGEEVRTGCAVTALQPEPGGGYRLTLSDGSQASAEAVILAVPAYVAGSLLEPFEPLLARRLAAIRYVSTLTVSLGYRRADVSHPLNGYGFVVPQREKRDLNACTWSSVKFPGRAPQDCVLLRCFLGGPGHEEVLACRDEEILKMVARELRDLMGIQAQPLVSRIFRWPRANPQYDVGHLERVRQMQSDGAVSQPGLFLAGSAYEGVGLPDCIDQGQQAAQKALQFLAILEPSHSLYR